MIRRFSTIIADDSSVFDHSGTNLQDIFGFVIQFSVFCEQTRYKHEFWAHLYSNLQLKDDSSGHFLFILI